MLVFVMYYIYVTSGSSLLIESTDSMIVMLQNVVGWATESVRGRGISRIAFKCPGNPIFLCVHYTLSPSHTLIPSLLSYNYPRDFYGNPA